MDTAATLQVLTAAIAAVGPTFTDKALALIKGGDKTIFIIEAYAVKGPRSSSIGTAYIKVQAYAKKAVDYKLKVTFVDGMLSPFEGVRGQVATHTEEMHHLPQDREFHSFPFSRTIPNGMGSELEAIVDVEVLSMDDRSVATQQLTVKYQF